MSAGHQAEVSVPVQRSDVIVLPSADTSDEAGCSVFAPVANGNGGEGAEDGSQRLVRLF